MSGREELAAKAAAEVDRWEKQLGDELTRMFDRQQAVVLARLQGTKARKHTRHWQPPGERKIDPAYVADAVRWVKDAAGSVAPIIRRIYTEVWARVSGQLGGGDVDPDALEAAVQSRLDLIAQGVDTATQEVTDFIAREEEAGTPMPDIVKGVRDLYQQRTSTWVQRITTLSAVGSINHAALSAAFAAGSVSKQWLSRRDSRVRDTHQHADGQVRPILAKFKLGGIPTHPVTSEVMFPGDPDPAVPIDEVINCRCTMLFSPRPAGPSGASGGGLGGAAGVAGAAAAVGAVAVGAGAAKGSAALAAMAAKAGLVAGVVTAAGAGAAALSGGDQEQPDDQQGARNPRAKDAGLDLEVKDRVRTAAGAHHYGQPIGSVIVPNVPLAPHFQTPSAGRPGARIPRAKPTPGKVVGHIGNAPVDLAGGDPAARALVAKYSPVGAVPEPDKTQILALRGRDGRIGAYVVWQTEDGAKPKGTILEVSVAPAIRGHGVGNDLVQLAAKVDSNVQPTTRPTTTAPGAPKPTTTSRPLPVPKGLPSIRSRATAADHAGTSGDFASDEARIGRLQKAYMRDGVDTRSLFSKGGRWSRQREAQQQEIIDHFLSKPTVKKDHQILVLGGLPGSGKTTTINSPAGQQALGINLDDYVEVNADEVKAEMIKRGMIPDYPGLSPDEAATLYHDESFEIAHSLMRQAAKRHLNFAYDTSLKSSGQMGFATGAGSRTMPPPWQTTLVLVDVPIATAKQRARDRYLAGGRYMPLALIDKMRPYGKRHSSLPSENFDVVKRQADRWVVFDNSGKDPVVVGQGGKGVRAPRASRVATSAATSNSRPATVAPSPAPVAAVASPGPAVPAGLPPVPAGAVVYAHPQGKHIYVLPDGSMQVWKPDGKRGTTSATPAQLATGHGQWKQVGSAGPAAPSSPAGARTGSSPTIVAAPSAPLQQSAGAPAPAGSLPVVPMDFNEAPLSDVPKYIADPNYVFQQKVDGIRGVLVVEPGKQPWFASKKGDRLVSSTAAKITDPMLAKMPPTPPGSPAYRVEGELLNGKFHVFDMYTVGGEQVPYEQRKAMADAWVDAVSPAMPQAVKLPTAVTAAEKQKLWDAVVASGAEGVMMKRKDSPYSGGARVSHTLKAKVTSTVDAVVVDTGIGGKDNAQIALNHNGKLTPIGTVSTLGKGPIKTGDVVEVEYLWATPSNTLTQPRIKRTRPDKNANDATSTDQLRFVDKSVLTLAAKALLAELEHARVELEVAR